MVYISCISSPSQKNNKNFQISCVTRTFLSIRFLLNHNCGTKFQSSEQFEYIIGTQQCPCIIRGLSVRDKTHTLPSVTRAGISELTYTCLSSSLSVCVWMNGAHVCMSKWVRLIAPRRQHCCEPAAFQFLTPARQAFTKKMKKKKNVFVDRAHWHLLSTALLNNSSYDFLWGTHKGMVLDQKWDSLHLFLINDKFTLISSTLLNATLSVWGKNRTVTPVQSAEAYLMAWRKLSNFI